MKDKYAIEATIHHILDRCLLFQELDEKYERGEYSVAGMLKVITDILETVGLDHLNFEEAMNR